MKKIKLITADSNRFLCITADDTEFLSKFQPINRYKHKENRDDYYYRHPATLNEVDLKDGKTRLRPSVQVHVSEYTKPIDSFYQISFAELNTEVCWYSGGSADYTQFTSAIFTSSNNLFVIQPDGSYKITPVESIVVGDKLIAIGEVKNGVVVEKIEKLSDSNKGFSVLKFVDGRENSDLIGVFVNGIAVC